MEKFKSRKLWAGLLVVVLGTTVTLVRPDAASLEFLGFLVTMYVGYVAGNIGEWKIRTPFMDPE